MGALLGAIAGPLVSGLSSIAGSLFQGSQAKDVANTQMAFQERMADTQYQRGVKDMRAAGLNPALMFGSGQPAPSPGGALADVPRYGQDVGAAVASAMQTIRLKAELENLAAQTAATAQQGNAAQRTSLASNVGYDKNGQPVFLTMSGDRPMAFDSGMVARGERGGDVWKPLSKQLADAQSDNLSAAAGLARANTQIRSPLAGLAGWSARGWKQIQDMLGGGR